MSSRKVHAGNTRGDEGRASETRRWGFTACDVDAAGEGGNGAVNENVDDTNGGADVAEALAAMAREGW